MNKSLYFIMFAAGAIVGSTASWYFLKDKYKKIAQEEIDSVKAIFTVRKDNKEEVVEEVKLDNIDIQVVEKQNFKPDVHEYAKILNEQRYSNNEKKEEVKDVIDRPYVISPDEFDELEGYETISLTYYADGYLTDDMDEIIEDIDNTVGFDSLKHFGEYEDDSVFVRNDALRCDYEILLDHRKYSDIYSRKSR